MISWEDLPRFDRHIQVIFLRREGAGGKFCERAGRAVGFVEINKYLSVFMRIGVVITPRGLGGVAVCQVHELDEKTPVWQLLDNQFMLLPTEFE